MSSTFTREQFQFVVSWTRELVSTKFTLSWSDRDYLEVIFFCFNSKHMAHAINCVSMFNLFLFYLHIFVVATKQLKVVVARVWNRMSTKIVCTIPKQPQADFLLFSAACLRGLETWIYFGILLVSMVFNLNSDFIVIDLVWRHTMFVIYKFNSLTLPIENRKPILWFQIAKCLINWPMH